MANTYGGVSLTTIGDKALAIVKRKIGPLKEYTTDFSDQFMAPGQAAITTRLWSYKTARTFTATDTTYTRDDSTSAAVTVTPNILYQKSDINELAAAATPANLEAELAMLGAEAIVAGAFATLNALVLNAAFSQKVITLVANFGFDDILSARSTIIGQGLGGEGLHTVLNAAGYGALLTATTVYPQIQRDSNQAGNVMAEFAGLGKVYELSEVAANGENLYGWTAGRDAFALVARQPRVPIKFSGDVYTAVDSESGLSVQVRSWFDADNGLDKIWVGSLFGASVGRAASLVRYVTP